MWKLGAAISVALFVFACGGDSGDDGLTPSIVCEGDSEGTGGSALSPDGTKDG